MARSSLIAVATFGCVGVAAAVSLVWFWGAAGDGHFEPAVALLGMLGGLTGILAERRAAAQDKRTAVLAALADELARAEDVLADPVFAPADGAPPAPHVYPRLPVSATDAALASGALTDHGDADLVNRLHRWRDEVNGVNRRLELTEVRLFGAGAAHEAEDFDRALHRDGGYLDHVRAHLRDLRSTMHPSP
jgi:hypothetical protein